MVNYHMSKKSLAGPQEQRGVVSNSYFTQKQITNYFPQGSILGPVLLIGGGCEVPCHDVYGLEEGVI